GESSNELTYILPWESLADRETRWTAFQNDPAWHKVRDDSERDGPIVADPHANALLGAEINQPSQFLGGTVIEAVSFLSLWLCCYSGLKLNVIFLYRSNFPASALQNACDAA